MKFLKTLRIFLLYYGLKYNKNFLSVIKIFTEKYIFFIRYRNPYSKALCKRKLISIKKWLQSTDYKNIAKVLFPFVQHCVNECFFFRSKIELQNIEERSFHIAGSSQGTGSGGSPLDVQSSIDSNCSC